MNTRILEHQRPSVTLSIREHIDICNDFNLVYRQKYGRNPERKHRHEFFKEKFKYNS